jgi:formamidopyrimidine-DNA glycosylase
MPELPEVETIARGLDRQVTGDRIESVWLGSKPEPLKSAAVEIAATLEQARIAAVRRMGKHIVFDLEQDQGPGQPMRAQRTTRPRPAAHGESARLRMGRAARVHANGEALPAKAQWIVHLGMTGRLQVCTRENELEKHTHAVLRLASGRELRFVDPRRFGRLSVLRDHEFAATGIEPLEIELERFTELFRTRKSPIKSALLNQNLLRGVGNIYADESLFRAAIRPRRRASTLSQDQLRRLYLAVQEVLKEAIALGGSSISDYLDADGEEGFFQLQHRVYGREGEPCLVCKSSIKRVVIAGRSSHYCPKCQK